MTAVVLLSGGVDSATLAYHAKQSGELALCLYVNYGQPARAQEYDAARRIAKRLNSPFHALHVDLPVAAMRIGSGETGPRIVPNRNLVMCGIGGAYAIAIGATAVWYGAIADDSPTYRDCTDEWRRSASSASDVEIVAPFGAMTKREVVDLAHELGVPLGDCWSCYEPTSAAACGSCNSCQQRELALAKRATR